MKFRFRDVFIIEYVVCVVVADVYGDGVSLSPSLFSVSLVLGLFIVRLSVYMSRVRVVVSVVLSISVALCASCQI